MQKNKTVCLRVSLCTGTSQISAMKAGELSGAAKKKPACRILRLRGALLRHKKTAVLPDDRQMGNPILCFAYLFQLTVGNFTESDNPAER